MKLEFRDAMALAERIQNLRDRLHSLWEAFDLDGILKKYEALKKEFERPDIWNDPGKAGDIGKRIKAIEEIIDPFLDVRNQIEDMFSMLNDIQEDEELSQEAEGILGELELKIEDIEQKLYLQGEHDHDNAIVSIHPGAGGTESQDWAQMLMRMYIRWAESHGFKVEILDLQPAEEAGIKSVTFLVKGPFAYGLLKSESGVHRLVRISPFDASKRRHTSFASVSVLPEIMEEDPEIEIKESDLKIETFRASGPGGQHMQKNETAVRITHIPTGIVAQSQSERSQHQNKLNAMKILRARLYEYYRRQKEAEKEQFTGPKKEIAWGNQIRSYVLQPYVLVKDHRTGWEDTNAREVLDGKIDDFIKAYLRKFSKVEV